MCLYRNTGPQDSTHLYVLKESILCCFPSCAFFTILMYGRPIHWEQHQKSCPRTLKLVSPQRQMTCLKKDQLYFKRKNGAIGQVIIGSKQNPVCVPGNSALTVPGQTNKIPSKLTCLVEQTQHHNLPPGIVINRCVATTKARSVPVILVNTNRQNVWIQQPLLAAELFGTDQVEEIEHRADMERQGDNIHISFSPVAPDSIRVRSEQVKTVTPNIDPPASSEKPSLALDLMWNLKILILRQKLIACLLN